MASHQTTVPHIPMVRSQSQPLKLRSQTSFFSSYTEPLVGFVPTAVRKVQRCQFVSCSTTMKMIAAEGNKQPYAVACIGDDYRFAWRTNQSTPSPESSGRFNGTIDCSDTSRKQWIRLVVPRLLPRVARLTIGQGIIFSVSSTSTNSGTPPLVTHPKILFCSEKSARSVCTSCRMLELPTRLPPTHNRMSRTYTAVFRSECQHHPLLALLAVDGQRPVESVCVAYLISSLSVLHPL